MFHVRTVDLREKKSPHKSPFHNNFKVYQIYKQFDDKTCGILRVLYEKLIWSNEFDRIIQFVGLFKYKCFYEKARFSSYECFN